MGVNPRAIAPKVIVRTMTLGAIALEPAKSEFASVPDSWLLAYASVNNLIVVTHEVYAPDITQKVKIPNVCVEFEIEYVDTFAMLRDLQIKFVRSTKGKPK